MGIADCIKQIRGDMRQADFAAKVGVPKNTVGRWERGEQVPGHDDLCKILEVFPEISPIWLLLGDGPMYTELRHREAASGVVKDAPALFQGESTKQAHAPSTHVGFDDLGMAEGMGLLAKVYSSGDAVFIRAINANLAAFGEAIDNKATARNTTLLMEEMNKRMVEMEKRLHHLEKENQAMRARKDSGDNEEIAAG